MKRAIAFIVFLIPLCVFSLGQENNSETISAIGVSTAWSEDNPCIHKKRIAIPKEIASCEILVHLKTDEEYVIFPSSIYCMKHYDGWQECLRVFSEGDNSVQSLALGTMSFAVVERYTEKGLAAGFLACKKLLLQLEREGISNVELRSWARAAIRIRHDQPDYGFRRFSEETDD
ncbi:MAG: hypothetical protein AAGG48_01540 [Planctomycetota bacterium]